MFFKKARLMSDSTISSSASRGCRGKEAGEDLHALMAQVRKLRVRSFIFFFFGGVGRVCASVKNEDWISRL